MNEKRKTRLGFWNAKYADDHTPWDLGEVSPPVRKLVEEHFPPEARVLVPGCGRGHEVIWLERLGYRVTAVDFADEPVRHLREEVERHGLRAEILQQDIFLLPAHLNGTFDVLLEQTCFCAIDPTLYGDYETLAYRMLKPGGRLLGVFMEVEDIEGPPFDTPLELLRSQFPVNRWRFEWNEHLPRNPKRPGEEYLAAFTRLGG